MINKDQIKQAIGDLIEPKLKWKINDLNLIREIDILDNDSLTLTINLVADGNEIHKKFREEVLNRLKPFGFKNINIRLDRIDVANQGIKHIKKIILVSSGKGGVGKSTVAVNLAALLHKNGKKVGIIDADIYGPSVPILLGMHEKPQVLADEVLMPVISHGMKTISIGYLVPPKSSISWRGQLVSGTILQFIRKVHWGELDFLIIDMPPGTGDIQLTIAHELKVTGVVLVSVPQQVVIGDVNRSITMYRQKEIPIIGVVQNMVSYTCEKCGHIQPIFSGAKDDFGVDVMASIPLDRELWESCDEGIPYVLKYNNKPIISEFQKIITKLESLT